MEGDLELARSLWSDKEVSKYISHGGFTDQMIIEKFNTELEHQKTHNVAYWPMFQLSDGKFVGVCGLRPFEISESAKKETDNILMLGYQLMRNMWGNGLATEATKRVAKYAIEDLKLTNVVAVHHPENHASGKVLLKSGFIKKYDIFFPKAGLEIPVYYFLDDERKLITY
ncbi:N-acetyltransferase [Tritrichomonas foetus]|uniref:N-acetyltransferase n=1 Tax=Tritrichomonas foetus TaxID=1144522 RepID=A0A1J4J6F4_9EUKA|nr:N-acetyltransferase [Tritrichomonas foetus]|eukprot:OHS94806.1 N-acetyltransferase [Tritrichomonas foetus]